MRILDLLGDSKKNEQDAIRFAEEVVRKLDVNPRDGKVTKGIHIKEFNLRIALVDDYIFYLFSIFLEEYVAGMINNPELRLLITPFVS